MSTPVSAEAPRPRAGTHRRTCRLGAASWSVPSRNSGTVGHRGLEGKSSHSMPKVGGGEKRGRRTRAAARNVTWPGCKCDFSLPNRVPREIGPAVSSLQTGPPGTRRQGGDGPPPTSRLCIWVPNLLSLFQTKDAATLRPTPPRPPDEGPEGTGPSEHNQPMWMPDTRNWAVLSLGPWTPQAPGCVQLEPGHSPGPQSEGTHAAERWPSRSRFL